MVTGRRDCEAPAIQWSQKQIQGYLPTVKQSHENREIQWSPDAASVRHPRATNEPKRNEQAWTWTNRELEQKWNWTNRELEQKWTWTVFLLEIVNICMELE